MEEALEMVKIKGLIGSIEAADAMVKSVQGAPTGTDSIGADYVTVLVKGDSAAVKAATTDTGAAVSRVGELISVHLMPRARTAVKQVLLK